KKRMRVQRFYRARDRPPKSVLTADSRAVVRAIGLRSTAFPKAEKGVRPSAGSARIRNASPPLPTTCPLRGKGPGANPEVRFLLYKHGIVKTCAWDQGQNVWLPRNKFNPYFPTILFQSTHLVRAP